MKIFLRPITLNDASYIIKWRNSPKVLNHCFNKNIVTLESNRLFYNENVLTGKYKQYIVERVDDDYGVVSYPIATVYLKDMDYFNNRCELCLFTSDDEEWNTDSQKLAIRYLLDIAFKQYNMNKVYSYVFCSNMDEVTLFKNAGFSIEAKFIKEAKGLDGNYNDAYKMVIFKENI